MMASPVFLSSIPKSGTNLLQKLLELAGISWSGKSVGGAFGRYELIKRLVRGPRPGETPILVGLEMDAVVSPTWVRRLLADPGGYVTSHAAYSEALHSLLLENGYRILFMVRHPAAILLSWANYIAEPGYYWEEAREYFSRLPLEERAKRMLHGVWIRDGMYYHSFREVLVRALQWVGKERVHVVRYEDLVGSRGGGDDAVQLETITRILEHVDIHDANLKDIQRNLYGGTHTFRKGSIDRWKTEFSSELIREVAGQLSDLPELSRLGYYW